MQESWYKISISRKKENSVKKSEEWSKVESSFIRDIIYFEPLKTLEVRFINGTIFSYVDVPKKIYDSFMKAKSKGAFLNKVVKKKFGRK